MKFLKLSSILPFLCGLALLLCLNGCGGNNGTILSNVELTPASAKLTPGNTSNPLQLAYDIGQSSHIQLVLSGPDGKSYTLRQNEARTPGHYILEFNGVVNTQENDLPQQRLLSAGTYKFQLDAIADGDGQHAQPQSGQFTVLDGAANQPPPVISNLAANPAVISPNFDAVDDVTSLSWQVSQPASVTVTIAGADGFLRVLKKATKFEPAQSNSITFDGLDVKQAPLPDGVYTYTVQASDNLGNVSRAASTVTVKGGGRPDATISSVEFSPQEVIKGGIITATIKVKNTGKVTIRTHGPDSGYTYDSRDTYRNIENGQYDYKAGFWRVGIGTNTSSDYPYRWGFGHDLQPGEEVTIIGQIRVNETDTKLTFFAGLLQEQVKNVRNNINPTTIKISP